MSQSAYRVAVIGGDGVGPEVMEAALEVLKATDIAFVFTSLEAGDECQEKTGVALPEKTLAQAMKSQAVLFGAVGKTAAQVILRLRAELKSFVNLRPAKSLPGVDCLHSACDVVLVRENTEGLYAGLDHRLSPNVATTTRLITREASLRIARWAFAHAKKAGRSLVTAVHKNNVLIETDGLFLECCRQAAGENPEIGYEEALVDSVGTRMVLDPTQFQVLVTTNLFGDILSDLTAGLVGGLGMCPSANLGDGAALFEPVHGSAPDIAGQGIANPYAAIACAAMMLDYLGEVQAAASITRAVEAAVAGGRTTPDLGGKLSTMEMSQAVVQEMG